MRKIKKMIYIYSQLIKYFSRNKEFAIHDYRDVFCEAKEVLEQYTSLRVEEARILDLGCGQRFPITLLFHTYGANVTGIDIDVIIPDFSIKGFIKIAKINGLERCLKTLIRHIFYDGTYYKILSKEAQKPLKFKEIDIRKMNASSLEFPDNHFDYICSNAVFEHLPDVEAVTKEMHRVLKPSGIANIGIHLFPSLSGGHNLEWTCPEQKPSKIVPPWDHLRQNLFPGHGFLNKFREKDYLAIFKNYFHILNIKSKYEGEEFLTDDIIRELKDFAKDELLKSSIQVIMKK